MKGLLVSAPVASVPLLDLKRQYAELGDAMNAALLKREMMSLIKLLRKSELNLRNVLRAEMCVINRFLTMRTT